MVHLVMAAAIAALVVKVALVEQILVLEALLDILAATLVVKVQAHLQMKLAKQAL